MTLRRMCEKLLTVPTLPEDERKTYEFLLSEFLEGPLEDTMFPENEAHLRGRYEWYFKPDGTRRRKAA